MNITRTNNQPNFKASVSKGPILAATDMRKVLSNRAYAHYQHQMNRELPMFGPDDLVHHEVEIIRHGKHGVDFFVTSKILGEDAQVVESLPPQASSAAKLRDAAWTALRHSSKGKKYATWEYRPLNPKYTGQNA